MIAVEVPIATGAAAVYPWGMATKLTRRFRLESTYGDPIQMYHARGEGAARRLLLPRAACPLGERDLRTDGTSFSLLPTRFEPRNEEQARVVRLAMGRLVAGESFLLRAPTGFGKTVVSCELIGQLGRSTLVVVTKEDVKHQWLAALDQVLGLSAKEVGIIQGDRFDVSGKPVSIAMIQSLCKLGRYPHWVYDSFGLMIADEVHRLGADEFSKVCWQVSARLRLGLSATPERRDGKDVVFRAHIGETRVSTFLATLRPTVAVVQTGWSVPRGLYHEPARMMGVYKKMARDPPRNALVARCAAMAYAKGRAVIVASALREGHLPSLGGALTAQGVARRDIGYYVGGMTEAEREGAKRKRILLATYGMIGEATDIPWMDTLVMATPRSDVTQVVGRILRVHEGKRDPLVFDLVDGGSPILSAYAAKRQGWYAKVKARVISAKV